MNFLKKYGWIILLLIVVIGVGSVGVKFLNDLFFERGLAAARAAYDQQIAEADARIKVNTEYYSAIIGTAEKARQDARAAHEAEIRKFKNDIGYFKSETAEALKVKEATVAQWYAAKQLDEITINLQTEQIEGLDLRVKGLISDWQQSDIDKDAAHKKIVNDLMMKFQSCQNWSAILEKKLARPKIWTYLKDAAYIGGAFLLGRASAK